MQIDKEREAQMQREEREARLRELELQAKLREDPHISSTKFDVSKHIRMVPPFQEKEVDKYFPHFEKIATSLKWPTDVWTLLLQSVLLGRAREVYTALPVGRSSDYTFVKEAILKAYELVPEAYRQKFRNFKKGDNQTYVEFAREKEQLFDRWCTSTQVNKNYDNLRQVILIEEFKGCVRDSIKTHLDEQKVTTLEDAARMADDYSLTHKTTFSNKGHATFQKYNVHKGPPYISTTSNSRSETTKFTNKVSQNPQNGPKSTGSSSLTCAYCKKKGHIISDCWVLERKKRQESGQALPNALTTLKSKPQSCIIEDSVKVKPTCSDNFMEAYRPFISEGFVSLKSENAHSYLLRSFGILELLSRYY